MNYQDLLNEIFAITTISKAMKNSPVINTKLEMFGLYTKDIVNLIKKYIDVDLGTFELNKYYEINYIYIAIGLIRNKTLEKQYEFIKNNIKFIDSWAITDSTYKYFEFLEFSEEKKIIKKMLKAKEEFLVRYGYLLLIKYVKEENLDRIFSLFKSDERYYVFMVEAWLLQIIFARYPEITLEFLKNSNLSSKIKLKAISKICDSYQVNDDYKNKVKELRKSIKNNSN